MHEQHRDIKWRFHCIAEEESEEEDEEDSGSEDAGTGEESELEQDGEADVAASEEASDEDESEEESEEEAEGDESDGEGQEDDGVPAAGALEQGRGEVKEAGGRVASGLTASTSRGPAAGELPFTLEAPSSYEEFAALVGGRPADELGLAVQRIRVCSAVALASGNRKKLQVTSHASCSSSNCH